jgi:hypothetical protein
MDGRFVIFAIMDDRKRCGYEWPHFVTFAIIDDRTS